MTKFKTWMIPNKILMIISFCFWTSCTSGIISTNQKLQMSSDEIVKALVEMYTINAAIHINDILYQDSTRNVYYAHIAKITGKDISIIQSDFEKLLLMPDTLIMLQNRAIDTLRVLQDQIYIKKSISVKPVLN